MAHMDKSRPTTVTVTRKEFTYACDNYMGWCPDCAEFTRDCTEPDAKNYDCSSCGNNNVLGAEQALLTGAITIDCQGESE